jgi:hypothetical protein
MALSNADVNLAGTAKRPPKLTAPGNDFLRRLSYSEKPAPSAFCGRG